MGDMTNILEKKRAFLGRRKRAYRMVFDSPVGKTVLADLAQFCRANETTFRDDERQHALLEGRRETWLRIAHHLNLTDEELWQLYDGRK
jgi:hypothetical protein